MSKLYIKSRYATIPHELLYNPKISMRAKGLFAYIQGKPDGWNFSAERISNESSEGLQAISSGLKELEKNGYLVRVKNSVNGTWVHEYHLHESPVHGSSLHPTKTHSMQSASMENPPDINKKDSNKKDLIKKEDNIYPSFDDFWDLYEKKRDKEKCKDKWSKISSKDKLEIMEFIPKYKASQPDSQYRKDPIRFLNNKTWNDELEVAEEQELPQDQKTFYQYKTIDDLLKDYPSQYTFIAYMFWRLWISEQETKTLIDATVEEWTNQVKNIIEIDKQRIERLIAVYQFFKQCKSQQAGYDTFWYSKTKTIASFRNTNQNGEYKLDLIANEVNEKIAKDSDFGRLVENKIKQFKEHESIKLS